MTTPSDGLRHLGLRYRSAADLAAGVTPYVRTALRHGDDVAAMVDPAVAARLRDAIGPDADLVGFPDPEEMFRSGPSSFVDRLRRLAHPDRRLLVVGQYSALDPGGLDCAAAEDGINLVLSDRSLTVICACADGHHSDLVDTHRRSHPRMIHVDVDRPNGEYRPPVGHSPASGGSWGEVVLRTPFRDTADCRLLRHRVADVADGLGLAGDDLRAAVLAVHEAVVLVCHTDLVVDDAHVLEVRVSEHAMLSEVRQRHAPAAPLDPTRPSSAEWPTPTAKMLDHIQPFCHGLTVHDTVDARITRVLTRRDRRFAETTDHGSLDDRAGPSAPGDDRRP